MRIIGVLAVGLLINIHHSAQAQRSLLDFYPSKILRETYDAEQSTYNQMLYDYRGKVLLSEIKCGCQLIGNDSLIIKLSVKMDTEEGRPLNDATLIAVAKGVVIRKVFMVDPQNSFIQTQDLNKYRLAISKIQIEKLNELSGVFKVWVPYPRDPNKGTFLYYRFLCSEEEIPIDDLDKLAANNE